MASNRPAYKRRIVLYDLNQSEREAVKQLAEKANRSISQWVADAVRQAISVAKELEE